MATKRKSTPKTKVERLRASMKPERREAPARRAEAVPKAPLHPSDEGPGRILSMHMSMEPEAERAEAPPGQQTGEKKSLIRRLWDYFFGAHRAG